MITRETVQHIAKLARLSLTDEEEQQYTAQLGKILDHFVALEAIDTTGIEPMSHALSVANVMRPDEIVPSLGHRALLKGAPASENSFYRVPKIGD